MVGNIGSRSDLPVPVHVHTCRSILSSLHVMPALLTHSQYYDAAVSKSPIRQGNTASPAATLLPPLTSLCRRRRYVLHSLAIIAGLGVANALRETCFTCLRSQVGLVSCSARAALMQSTATFDDLLLFGSLWIYSNRLKLYLSGTSPPPCSRYVLTSIPVRT